MQFGQFWRSLWGLGTKSNFNIFGKTPNEVAICMKGAGTSHKDILFKAHLSEKSLLFILNQDLECN